MIEATTRESVLSLLHAVRERPTELPLAEVVELAGRGVHVSVERTGTEPVVFVTPRPDPRFDVLSTREFEVATLIAAGFSNGQIASALFISVGTVKDHVHAVLVKTKLASRTEVAACWYGPR